MLALLPSKKKVVGSHLLIASVNRMSYHY